MRSKPGNKLKKIRSLVLALSLTGCITEPEHKVIHEDYQMPPSCLHSDSTTWTDTTETQAMSCKIDPSVSPIPPGP